MLGYIALTGKELSELSQNKSKGISFYPKPKIENIFLDYTGDEFRVFEIEATGKIIKGYFSCKSKSIKIIREIPEHEFEAILWERVNDENLQIDVVAKVNMANYRLFLYKFITDDNYIVRFEVARQGYGLDTLIKDKSWIVRAEVAKKGYGLEKLVKDKDSRVRRVIASKGLFLDRLIDDDDFEVRVSVAKQGYGLDKLINDESIFVRAAVAKQGYGLDKLSEDKSLYVKTIANRLMENF